MTVKCETCGGSGWVDSSCPTPGGPCGYKVHCPDCVDGRTASPEVIERMAKVIFDAGLIPDDPESWESVPEWVRDEYRTTARAAWVAEHRKDET